MAEKSRPILYSKDQVLLATLTFMIITSLSSRAEYRVYEYDILSTEGLPSKKFLSVIHPRAIKYYYQIYSEDLFLKRTWICPGDTSKKDFCPSPYSQLVEREIAGETQNE